MLRTGEGKVYQLWEWSLINKEERKIVEVTDYCECEPPGEGVAWSLSSSGKTAISSGPIPPVSKEQIFGFGKSLR